MAIGWIFWPLAKCRSAGAARGGCQHSAGAVPERRRGSGSYAAGWTTCSGASFRSLAEGSHGSPAYTGQATLSRWPLCSPRLIRFERQSAFWHPRWWVPNAPIFQERVGGRIALVTEARIAGRPLAVYNLHLESRGDDQLRASQLQEVLAGTMTVPPGTPVIVAGDMNFDTSQPAAASLVEHSGLCDA